jgi:hypothetical protein
LQSLCYSASEIKIFLIKASVIAFQFSSLFDLHDLHTILLLRFQELLFRGFLLAALRSPQPPAVQPANKPLRTEPLLGQLDAVLVSGVIHIIAESEFCLLTL